MADSVSKNGVWIDTKTNKVVESQPEEGVQLVPAGGTIDAATQKLVDNAKDALAEAASAEKASSK